MAKIRIKDIANAAGVSVGTVDRVIHGRGRVAKAVEQKVKDAIKSLNYQPNLAARSLARNRNHKIAIVLPTQEQDEFWVAQRRGVERGLRGTKDFGLTGEIFSFNDQVQGDLLRLSSEIFGRGYEALVVAPTVTEEASIILDKCEELNIPYVQINSLLERDHRNSLGYVGQDSFRSGRLAAKLLDVSTHDGGHLAVLHMESDVDNSAHLISKEAGFYDYFSDMPEYHITTERLPDIDNKASLLERVQEIIEAGAQGLFVTTSRIHHIVEIMTKLNREDIILVGFDVIPKNIEALSQYKKLFLINQNPSLQGYYGVMRLFDFILRNERVDNKKYLPLDIVTLENVSNYRHMQDRDNVEIET